MNRTKLPLLTLALAVVLLVVAQANSSQPSEDDAVLPPNADNIEIHHVKLINGVMHEDHPIVMYKEDFVSEDYDPKKNDTPTTVQHKKHRHMRHHRVIVDEPRLQFDTLPDTPIIIDDVVPPSKEELLLKHPKKYRSRQRRQAIAWRTGNFYTTPYSSFYYQAPASNAYLPPLTNYPFQRVPVAGKPPKKTGKLPQWDIKPQTTEGPIDIGSRLDVDVSNPLHHNSNPADADFSVFDQPRPQSNQRPDSSRNPPPPPQPQRPSTSWSPTETPEEARPIWGPSVSRQPNSVQGSPSNSRPQQQRPWQTTTAPTTRSPAVNTSPRVSNCVWAIVNCCSRGSTKIRYACFEDFNCHGAFWGVNPCADETIRDGTIAFVTNTFS
ncbi:uncharacterized protein Dwil_GK22477, isoform C [Drosophila willistoni]|uniref:Uncharacterized protein, isoform C n=1 Tax=Drosophila willistoni TaxID=7260 RepID=B4NFR4_DROWI|nr:uncharacterized protein LOC6649780 isoform X2 [Drosophila willistoni]EDW83131.2 uncharacterized protein Dwil_GK22477, isoform C [Drosophila willistoni]